MKTELALLMQTDGKPAMPEALADLVKLLATILKTVSHRSALQCHNECNTALKKHRALNRPDLIKY